MSNYSIRSLEGKLILAATILASGMAFLDGTVVNIAIPVIQSSFGATLGQMQWVVNSYALILASFILISGSFGDMYGRKKIFVYGIGLFVIASFLCGVSQSIEQLIAFRTLQGIGAAMMIPGSLSIINSAFDSKEHGKAIGLWSGFAGGVAAIGPFIGGWLVETLGWSSIFSINIPLGLLALFLTLRYVPETRNPHVKQLDFLGTLLLLVGLLGISYSLIEAPAKGFSDFWVVSSFIFGIASLITFYFVEKRVKEPLVPFHIFSSSLVKGANLITLFLYFALNGIIFFLILNIQQLQNFSPLLAGLSLLPSILIITFLSGYGGSLSDKIGPRIPLIVGPLLVAIGIITMIFPGKNINYFTAFLPGLVLFGLGMSLVVAPLTKSALSVDVNYSGTASGVNNAVSRVASLLAIALLGAVMATIFTDSLKRNIAVSSLSSIEKQQIIEQKDKLAAITIPKSFSPYSKKVAEDSIDTAFLTAFRIVMGISAALALLSVFIAYFTIHNKKHL